MLADIAVLAASPIACGGRRDHTFGTSENEIVRQAGVQRHALS